MGCEPRSIGRRRGTGSVRGKSGKGKKYGGNNAKMLNISQSKKEKTGNVPSRFLRGEYFSYFRSVTVVQSIL